MTLTHRFRALLGAALLSALLFVAGTSTALASTDPQTLTFGVAPGPYGDMVNQTIKPQLEKKGYKVVVREFSDYVSPTWRWRTAELVPTCSSTHSIWKSLQLTNA